MLSQHTNRGNGVRQRESSSHSKYFARKKWTPRRTDTYEHWAYQSRQKSRCRTMWMRARKLYQILWHSCQYIYHCNQRCWCRQRRRQRWWWDDYDVGTDCSNVLIQWTLQWMFGILLRARGDDGLLVFFMLRSHNSQLSIVTTARRIRIRTLDVTKEQKRQ